MQLILGFAREGTYVSKFRRPATTIFPLGIEKNYKKTNIVSSSK